MISAALKTPLEIRLGICMYKTSLLHRPDDYIGFAPSCPPTFYNKIAPMFTPIGVRGGGAGGAASPPGLEKFQGKLCFQGNPKFLKNPE